MLNSISVILGSVLLSIGICSPALGRVNEHSPMLVMFGLIIVAVTLYSDHCKDKRRNR